MCLNKLEQTPRISSLPIKVYKIILSNNKSPFQYQEYRHGINEPAPLKPLEAIKFPENDDIIEGGYLHAYTTLDSAVRNVLSLILIKSIKPGDIKVTEMYIPPETEYWVGAADEIAAKKLDWPENAEEWNSESLDYSVIDPVFGRNPQ